MWLKETPTFLDHFIRKQLNKLSECKACHGTGWKVMFEAVDNITDMQLNEPCDVCGQYGYYPIPKWLMWLMKREERRNAV